MGRRLEGPGPQFSPAIIAKVKKKYPQFVMIAEVYDMGKDMSYKLQRQGFDFTYDKKLYDRIVDGDTTGVYEHLRADPGFQQHLVRFVRTTMKQGPRQNWGPAAADRPPSFVRPCPACGFFTRANWES